MSNVLESLNEEQKRAVKQIQGPLLILAGAGSGKTRVLTNRTAYMIRECGVSPFNILAITFTNKAASEMRRRIDEIVGYGSESIWVSTFHSMCVRILRRYGDRIGYDNSFTIYDTDDSKVLMKDVCKRLKIDTKQSPERVFLWEISHAKDELISEYDYAKKASYDFTLQDTARVYREYQESLKKNNAMDFDDLIVKTIELFKSCPEVLLNYQERFKYIMVDEYQDTNTAQFELVRLLSDRYRNICVVGDDDQSIYKFRGANIRNILDFETHYRDACVIKLEENYRSTQNILDAANSVIHNNMGRKDKTLWTGRGEGEKIHLRQLDSAYDEAEFVVDDIRKNKREGDLEYRDTAVLYRTNAQSRAIEEKLIMAGIPYNVVGGVNFYSRKEIKDLLAYLKVIDNGRDDLAVKRIINVPKRGIGSSSVSKLESFAEANGLSFYEALKRAYMIIPGKSLSKINEFTELIEELRKEAGEVSLEDLVNEILDRTEYIEKLEANDEYDAKARVENIDEFITKVVAFEEGSEDREEDSIGIEDKEREAEDQEERSILSRFLQEVALVADIDKVSEDDNRVLLMTLHSAKGLEFPYVYITGMEEGLFPGYMAISSEDEGELEEERRLCYVGITRAKEHLTLTSARSRMVRGERQYHAPSRFLDEIPVKLFDSNVRKPRIREEDRPYPATVKVQKEVFRTKPYASSSQTSKYRLAEEKKPFIAKAAIKTGKSMLSDCKDELEYGVGDRVRHIKFGDGEVLEIKSGGRDYEVTVKFDGPGVKKMFAGFAKLVKIM
ncbi:MAG: UvrD-helicase domain-containing protein [Lachnospiraceae bacterium]|nr:UvrD-helicase domain-containing protein [Lachnospiraceae bacterium]